MIKRAESQLELFRVRGSRPPGRRKGIGKPKPVSERSEVKGVCPESDPEPRKCMKGGGADSLRKDAGHTERRARDERSSGLPGSQTASSYGQNMEQPGGEVRLLRDKTREYSELSSTAKSGDGRLSGMGAGLAMKQGNARGVKAPTYQRPSREKQGRYAESDDALGN